MIKRERQFLLHSALNMQMSIPGSSKLTEDSTKATTTELSYHIKKEEIVRLIMHSLIDLGYQKTANFLQNESSIELEPKVVTYFRNSILKGDWTLAELLLKNLTKPSVFHKAQFLLKQQKFLELLEQEKIIQALQVLRDEIKPLGENIDRLNQLSSLMLCSSIEELKEQDEWDGAKGNSRNIVLLELQNYIDSSTMIPKNRLLTLINQSMEWQKDQCFYHNSRNDLEISLFTNHACDRDLLPLNTIQVLCGHVDEIWHVAYSNDGKYLASISKDKSCIIWNMETFECMLTFKNTVGGSYCTWSPDNSMLAICGTDNAVRLWNPYTGSLIENYTLHEDQVTSCVWLPDNQHFMTGACDKTIFMWSIRNSNPLARWSVQRVTDMKITQDGKRLVTIGLDKSITIYNVEDLNITEVDKIIEEGTITSLSITKDGKFALVNIQDIQEIHLWDLDLLDLVHRYHGQKQHEFIIRSTIGGSDESLILSGSEDNRVYIWSRDQEILLDALEGHTSTVNCISWCPTKLSQYVSAGDDGIIRVWEAKK